MAKTLADMTAEERAKCVGMWCEWDGGLRIIGQIFAPHVTFCGLVRPNDWGLPATADLELVTPRFDLPRAWNPDGTPPKGKWEEGWCYTGGTPTGDFACLVETQDGTAYTSEETPTGDIRRFITEWENANV